MSLLKYKSLLWLSFGTFVLFALSYFREGFFLSLNGVILNSPSSNASFNVLLPYFKEIDAEVLIQLKWLGTFLFSFFFMSLTLYFLNQVFKTKNLLIFMGSVYLLMLMLALTIGAIGYFIFNFKDVYFIIRNIFGFIQSPLPYFIAVPLFYFLVQKQKIS